MGGKVPLVRTKVSWQERMTLMDTDPDTDNETVLAWHRSRGYIVVGPRRIFP